MMLFYIHFLKTVHTTLLQAYSLYLQIHMLKNCQLGIVLLDEIVVLNLRKYYMLTYNHEKVNSYDYKVGQGYIWLFYLLG